MKLIFERLILSLIFIVPLVFSEGWIFSNDFLRLWIIYFGVFLGWIVWAVMIFEKKKINLPAKKFLVGVGLWFLSLFISAVFGLSFKESLIGRYGLWTTSIFSYFVFFSLAYFVFFLSSSNRFFKNRLLLTVIFSGLVLMGYEIAYNWQVISEIRNGWRMSANFRNPLGFGFYVTVLLALSVSMFLLAKKKIALFASFAGVILFGLGLLLSQSRSSWLVMLTMGVIIFMVVTRKKFVEPVRWRLVLLVGLLFMMAFLPLIISRMSIDLNSPRVSHRIRIGEWKTGLKIWQENIWTGVGTENIDLVYPRFRNKGLNLVAEEWKWRTLTIRNYYVEILATQGILGMGVVVYWLLILRRKITKTNFVTTMALLAYGIHAFMYNPNNGVVMLAFVFLGLIIRDRKNTVEIKIKSILGRFLIGAILFMSALVLYFLCRVVFSEIASWRSVELLSEDSETSIVLAQKAYSLNPLFDKNLRLVLLTYQETLRKGEVAESKREEMLLDFEKNLNILTGKNLLDIENLKNIAGGYMRLEGWRNLPREKAIFWGKRLVEVDPTAPGNWDTLGIIYLDNKEYDKALEVYDFIIFDLKPDYGYAYFHIGETYRQKGEPEKSIPYYEKALELGADFAGAAGEIEEAKEEVVNIAY